MDTLDTGTNATTARNDIGEGQIMNTNATIRFMCDFAQKSVVGNGIRSQTSDDPFVASAADTRLSG